MENIPMKICTSALKTESLNGKNLEINYKSGGHYKGDVVDNKRYGKGSMYWPDGSVYHGDFVNDQRSGQGYQVYRDKSFYKGQFVRDKRNGYGVQKFQNGEMYEGHFFQDLRHGVGKYVWPKECEFVGLFYANTKEGYGTTKFANGNIFQGLYKDDKREGPGILTYKDTQLQDVGLWSGLRLIRISCRLPGLFSLSHYRHYRCSKRELPIITAADTWISPSLLKDLSNIADFSSDVFEKIKDIYLEYPDCCNVKVNHELFNKVYIQQASGMIDLQRTCRLWNITPSLENLQKHILKHSFKQTLINVDDILNYNRHCFNPEGLLENFSGQLLWASACGKNAIVERILNEDIIHPDVAGTDGNTALINATAIGNCAMINSLLNHGANVNQLNDEGCSALTVGFLLLYTVERLHMNLICDAPGRLPMDTDESSPGSTAASLIAGGDNSKLSVNAQNPTSVLAERTNSMELESLEDYQTGSPRNLISADDVDSGISRSSLFRQRKASRRISPNSLDKKDPAKKKSTGNFPSASIPSQNPLLKAREKTSTQGRLSSLESPRVSFYFDKAMAELKPLELKTSTDLPNIANEVTAKDGIFISNSYACQAGLDSLNRSSSWRKNYRVSDWMNSTNFEKAESDSKTILQTKESPARKDVEEFTKKFVQKISRNLFSASWNQDKEKSFVDKKKNPHQECVDFLLKRGADPNSSSCPWPVLFIAVRALDVPMVKRLLLKGANANASLSKEEGGIYPLHVACSLPSKEGYETVELLLNSLADSDARMSSDNSYLDAGQLTEIPENALDKANWASSGGRTPLHIVCGHENNKEEAARIAQLLLENRANPNLLCNGLSPLGIAIARGNVAAVDVLLANGADPSLPLGLGLGNPLCMAVLGHFKGNLSSFTCLQLMTKLVKAGADILAKIPIGQKQIEGSIVDFCYHLFQQDYRIAHIPTHALSLAEREMYKNRKDIGYHAGVLLREAALELLKKDDEPSGTGKTKTSSESRNVTFDFHTGTEEKSELNRMSQKQFWSLLDFCYECGRSVNVKLIPCTRCKAVSYCSKACKTRAWTTRHRNECSKEEKRKSSSKGRKGTRSTASSSKGGQKTRPKISQQAPAGNKKEKTTMTTKHCIQNYSLV